MLGEFATAELVRLKTDILTPKIHAVEAGVHPLVGAAFMLMYCLEGNVGVDMPGREIPSEYKTSFCNELAHIQVQLSTICLPKIGKVLGRNGDGSFIQDLVPGIGGPFETAAEYFKAWADKSEFKMDQDRLRAGCGDLADETIPQVNGFRESIRGLADRLSISNNGPFPLCHGDFGHNNIIFDDQYKVLGLIDWEFAFAAPWEVFAEFPLNLAITPAKMEAPWVYDAEGVPVG